MKKIVVPIDHNKWDDIRIVKLVHEAGNSLCNISILSGKRYVNVKSISSMMDYFSRFHPSKLTDIYLEGQDEDETALWLMEFFD